MSQSRESKKQIAGACAIKNISSAVLSSDGNMTSLSKENGCCFFCRKRLCKKVDYSFFCPATLRSLHQKIPKNFKHYLYATTVGNIFALS
jgi:hypothetical protein